MDIFSNNIINKSDITDIIDSGIEGGQGQIFYGKYKNKKVVIKKFNSQNSILRELQAYLKLKHEAIVDFYGCFIDDDGELNIVLEYVEGVVLSDLIADNLLIKRQKLIVLKKISGLLLYLKQNHIIHRDLKPDNFLVNINTNDNEDILLKVIDFGISKISERTNTNINTTSCTIHYCPPELFEVDKNKLISYKYDIWSFGLIVFYVFTEKLPWAKLNPMQIEFCLIKKKAFPIESVDDNEIKKLIELCTRINFNERINPETILLLLDKLLVNESICNMDFSNKEYYV